MQWYDDIERVEVAQDRESWKSEREAYAQFWANEDKRGTLGAVLTPHRLEDYFYGVQKHMWRIIRQQRKETAEPIETNQIHEEEWKNYLTEPFKGYNSDYQHIPAIRQNIETNEQKGPVPKVIVMGSSTASETTINTSTDSSNTMVTTMTATDGDNTEDSLDITESVDIMNSDNTLEGGRHYNQILQPTPMSPKTPTTAKHDSKFFFEAEATPKTAYFKNEEKFVFDTTAQNEVNCIPEEKSVERLMEQQVEALRQEARRRNSYKAAQNDLDSIDVAFDNIVVHRRHSEFDSQRSSGCYKPASPKERRNRRKIESNLDDQKEGSDKSSPKEMNGKPERSSPKHSKLDHTLEASPEHKNGTASPKPRHRHKKTNKRHHSPSKYKGDKFTYDEKHIAKYREKARMTPPDLRVDFFSESVDNCQAGGGGGSGALLVPISSEKRGSVCLNKCLREVGAQLETTATSPINVTTNPLENSVHFGGRKAPQATIVVQQPSVSLDQANVSTILLKNGSEFVSNVESVGNKLCLKKQREEHMKQLLD
ncbi:hypothetical protein ILUMI_08074, partial [Ignelater luminosus]